MDKDSAAYAATVGTFVTVLLMLVGFAMTQDPPTPADAAVGKGLIALGGAAAIISFGSFVRFFELREREKDRPMPKPDRTES